MLRGGIYLIRATSTVADAVTRHPITDVVDIVNRGSVLAEQFDKLRSETMTNLLIEPDDPDAALSPVIMHFAVYLNDARELDVDFVIACSGTEETAVAFVDETMSRAINMIGDLRA